MQGVALCLGYVCWTGGLPCCMLSLTCAVPSCVSMRSSGGLLCASCSWRACVLLASVCLGVLQQASVVAAQEAAKLQTVPQMLVSIAAALGRGQVLLVVFCGSCLLLLSP